MSEPAKMVSAATTLPCGVAAVQPELCGTAAWLTYTGGQRELGWYDRRDTQNNTPSTHASLLHPPPLLHLSLSPPPPAQIRGCQRLLKDIL